MTRLVVVELHVLGALQLVLLQLRHEVCALILLLLPQLVRRAALAELGPRPRNAIVSVRLGLLNLPAVRRRKCMHRRASIFDVSMNESRRNRMAALACASVWYPTKANLARVSWGWLCEGPHRRLACSLSCVTSPCLPNISCSLDSLMFFGLEKYVEMTRAEGREEAGLD